MKHKAIIIGLVVLCCKILTAQDFDGYGKVEKEYKCYHPYLQYLGIKQVYGKADVYGTGSMSNYHMYRGGASYGERARIIEAIISEHCTFLEERDYVIDYDSRYYWKHNTSLSKSVINMMHRAQAFVSVGWFRYTDGTTYKVFNVVCDKHWDKPELCNEYECYTIDTKEQ